MTAGLDIGQTGPDVRWKSIFLSSLLGLGIATDAQQPAPNIAGTLYYNTDSSSLKVNDGFSWEDVGYWIGSGSDIYYTAGIDGTGHVGIITRPLTLLFLPLMALLSHLLAGSNSLIRLHRRQQPRVETRLLFSATVPMEM